MSSEMGLALVIFAVSVSAMSIPDLSLATETPAANFTSLEDADGSPCYGCALQKQVAEEVLPADALQMMRIELIKQQILRKLRLKAPPQPRVSKSGLPPLIAEGTLLSTETDEYEHLSEEDDFYGTTQQVVIFPENITANCSTVHPTICLSFQLLQDIRISRVTLADLFLHKEADDDDTSNHTYVVSEVIPDPSHGGFRKRVVDIQEGASSSGWLQFEVGHAVAQWTARATETHILEVSCITCQYTNAELTVSTDEDKRPFLVVHTATLNRVTRRRRSIECTEETSLCCRQSFYLSFKDIGWNDWIVQPYGYQAYYCRGSCLSEVSIPRYHHTTVMQRYLQSPVARAENVTLSLCCTPSLMSSIPLIYIDDNGNIFNKRLPNMVVEACDCA